MNKLLCYLTPALVVLAVVAGSVSVVARAQDATARRRPRSRVPRRRPGRPTLRVPAALARARANSRDGQLTDSAVQTAVKTEYFPNQLTVIPRDGG